MTTNIHLQLASKSPRRRALLEQIGVHYRVVSVDVPEQRAKDESPHTYVERLAIAKAREGARAFPGLPTLGADTIVVCEGEVLEKPADCDACVSMLLKLSSRTHQVITAVAIADGKGCSSKVSTTEVSFRAIDADEARRYWQTSEPRDKAGAYGIQGLGGVFVTRLEGSYSGVVGLPLEATYELLDEFNVPVWQTATQS